MGQPAAATAPATRDAVLRLIQGDIVPRLADVYRDRQQRHRSARRGAAPSTTPAAASPPHALSDAACALTPELITRLALDAMRLDEAAVAGHVEAAQASGMTAENILLDLLAPAARHLGDLWLEDRATILDVTLGVMRLQARMQLLLAVVHPAARAGAQRSIALWAVPGSKHRFGVAMLAEVFKLRGWHVELGQIEDPFQMASVLRERSYDVVGLSLGSSEQTFMLEACIQAARLTSRNRDVIVMAGGPAFLSEAGLVGRLDVDAVADNAEDALLQAELLLDRRSTVPRPAAPRQGSLAASPGVVGWSG